MNIFVLDRDPILAARAHCDAHVVKMVLETAQILSTVAHLRGLSFDGQYKSSHANTKIVRWAAQSIENLWWLWSVAGELVVEYKRRYGKDHRSMDCIVNSYWALFPTTFSLPGEPSSFCFKAQEDYERNHADRIDHADPVNSYREYYRWKNAEWAAKGRPMRWTNRQLPDWMGPQE